MARAAGVTTERFWDESTRARGGHLVHPLHLDWKRHVTQNWRAGDPLIFAKTIQMLSVKDLSGWFYVIQTYSFKYINMILRIRSGIWKLVEALFTARCLCLCFQLVRVFRHLRRWIDMLGEWISPPKKNKWGLCLGHFSYTIFSYTVLKVDGEPLPKGRLVRGDDTPTH